MAKCSDLSTIQLTLCEKSSDANVDDDTIKLIMNEMISILELNDDAIKLIINEIIHVLQLNDNDNKDRIITYLLENGRQSLVIYQKDIIPDIYTDVMVSNDSKLMILFKKYFQQQWEIQYGKSNEWFISFLKQYQNKEKHELYEYVLVRTAEYGNKYMKDCPILSIVLQLLFEGIDDQCLKETNIFNNLWFGITNDGLKSITKYSDYITKDVLDQLINKEQLVLFQALREYYRPKLFKLLEESNIKDKENLYELVLDNVAEYGWLAGLQAVQNKIVPRYFQILLEKIPSQKQQQQSTSLNVNGNGRRSVKERLLARLTDTSSISGNTPVKQDSTETAALRHIFNDAAYFLIKSVNKENISLAKAKGVWSTKPANEDKLNQAFRDHRTVILFFSVAKSKAFQGFARMSSEARYDSEPVNWILPPGMHNKVSEGVIYIDWITCRSLPFSKTLHLFNSRNENKRVKRGRDGQEIDSHCAEALCHLFPSDPTIDVMSIAIKATKNKKDYSSQSQSHPTIPIESSLSSLIIKRQISKDHNRRSSPNNKRRPTSSDFLSRHSSNRSHHRSLSNHDRHRHEQSRSREHNSKDIQRKRRRRSGSSHSYHDSTSSSNRKHAHHNNGDQPSNSNANKTAANISSGTNPEYIKYLSAIHALYAGSGNALYLSGSYPMGYDHHGMPVSMHSGGHNIPTNMYLPQSTSSASSRSRNPTDYEEEINAFLRHSTASNSYQTNDNR